MPSEPLPRSPVGTGSEPPPPPARMPGPERRTRWDACRVLRRMLTRLSIHRQDAPAPGAHLIRQPAPRLMRACNLSAFDMRRALETLKAEARIKRAARVRP